MYPDPRIPSQLYLISSENNQPGEENVEDHAMKLGEKTEEILLGKYPISYSIRCY